MENHKVSNLTGTKLEEYSEELISNLLIETNYYKTFCSIIKRGEQQAENYIYSILNEEQKNHIKKIKSQYRSLAIRYENERKPNTLK